MNERASLTAAGNPVQGMTDGRQVADEWLLGIRAIGRAQAADDVMAQLSALIERGELAEGQRLPSEKQLASMFGVSRPVIREALGGLRSIGLVTSRSGSGSFVSNGSSALQRTLLLGRFPIAQLHEVRTHLEVPGAALAAERATSEQISELSGLVEEMTGRHGRRYSEIDAAFHVALANCTANAVHVRLITDLHELIVANSELALSAAIERHVQATAEHAEIAEAVRARDPERARAAMLAHLTRVSHLLAGDGVADGR